jgi:hypothetical protein
MNSAYAALSRLEENDFHKNLVQMPGGKPTAMAERRNIATRRRDD